MKRFRSLRTREKGFVLLYMSVVLTGLLLFTGLAVDAGRAYVVKAQLTKAVDGAALGAARELNSGSPRSKAAQIFQANFPSGYMVTTSVTDPNTDPNFFASQVDAASGVNTVTVNATAVLPTTFMRLGNFDTVTVASTGQATRRMVDLSIILDVSSSIGSKWSSVHDAVQTFINAFDQNNDRLALLTFSNGARVVDAMPSSRGFNKTKLLSDVPSTLPGGSTLMVEGLYRGWDELRSVPNGSQSGLRVIVLFTDGASNGVPANWTGSGISSSIRTYDFPKAANYDPDSQLWDSPYLVGPVDTQSGGNVGTQISQQIAWAQGGPSYPGSGWTGTYPLMPAASLHSYHRSAGIPTSFPLSSSTLTVNGVAQSTKRGLYKDTTTNKYQATIWNVNNAARNLVEIVGDAARGDTSGDYKIRIYTIGMGYLLRDNIGTMPEMPEDILKRVANDKSSPDFNANQLEGKYFYAATASDVGPAFEQLQNQILRLTK